MCYRFLLCIISITFTFLSFPRIIDAQSIVRGVIVEEDSEEALWFANVALLTPGDSAVVAGATTGEDGRFEIQTQPGKYLLWVSYVGYQDEWRELKLEQGARRLGPIKLGSSASQLQEVTVTAAASIFQSDFDKRVFNVENTVLAEGGTAVQLLETLPSIQVDDEGGISMRGSGDILIYVNGRPTNLTGDETGSFLEQFPANAIQSVELITNPSARYDAAGVGGIINIVLRESQLRGFNGQVNASVGSNHKYTAGINSNYRQGIMNLQANYAYQYRQFWRVGDNFRRMSNPMVSPFLDQDFSSTRYNQSHVARTGVELRFTERQTLGVFGNVNLRDNRGDWRCNIRNLDATMGLDSMLRRDLNEQRSSVNLEFGANYDWEIDDAGGRLQAMASYSADRGDQLENFDQLFFNSEMVEIPENRLLQLLERPRRNNLFVAQLDWERPLSDNTRVDAGLKTTMSRDFPEQIFQEFNPRSSVFEENAFFTNQFNFSEDVHAAYFILRQKIERFQFQAGLRAELSLTESFQPKIDSTFVNNYFDLFPSLNLSYDLRDNEAIQFNYSRRINRPNRWRLTPFFSPRDLLNLRTGNPYLQPEYTHNLELAYARGWPVFSLTATGYYRHTTDAFARIFSLFDGNVVLMDWTNANTQRNLGLELIKQMNFHRNIDATLTTNLFHANIAGPGEGEPFSNSNFSWTLSLLGNMRIPNIASLQVMGNYRGPIVLPQGVIQPMFGLNIGLRRNILNQNGTLSLNLSDVFNTQVFSVETIAGNFAQNRRFNWETRILTLSFSYRFNDFKNGRSERSRDGDDMGGEDGMF
jgi:iron complex outermembrane receptor protein